MSHDHPGQDDPSGGRDEFDHFFSDTSARREAEDPDSTAWAGQPYDADRTHAVEHASYVRPPQPMHDEYAPAGPDYYQPEPYYEEPPRRRGTMWAPILVIVASLAIVAVVVAVILHNSTGRMKANPATPTATVTETTTRGASPTSSGPSSSQSTGSASSGASPTSSGYATALPGEASSCPGSSSYGTGPATSCAFAAVVTNLYNAEKNSDGRASFAAESPTTHEKYNVSCHQESYVTCTTDTGAVVYILHQ
ncbi:hypothetical protein [Flexivirga caeni]|uniref:Uncharacterized protein n=1 Tax=Flexivirga caeni TaxID=2294115 RepID=A0A3M9M285_9MICO|nr:hypothetical protein [Flexivirga caeni]RNI19664.1 hypothetical protein EFY87_16340 [Flexivirga caeni]